MKKTGCIAGSHFFSYRDKVEKEIAKSISSLGEKNKLRDACEYALTNGGKRFRPLIVLMISEALGKGLPIMDAALSVEFFHTASLIADDLPCMDNDDERRDKPSLHKVYGETVALLASYALITSAFERIHLCASAMRKSGAYSPEFCDHVCRLALESATHSSGIHGATAGQFLDLYPPILNLETVKQVIYKKTVTLFEVSFMFGWLFGGGDLNLLDKVQKTAYHFGMAFQIADDLDDMTQDEKKQRDISMARLLGRDRAFSVFEGEMLSFENLLKELSLYTPSFQKLSDMLYQHAALQVGSVS